MKKQTPVKAYLGQILILDKRIDQLQSDADEIIKSAMRIKSPNLDANKVQSVGTKSTVENAISRYEDKITDINKLIDKYVDIRTKISNQILEMDDPRYIDILRKRYLEYKTLEKIACEMCYSFGRVKHIHGEALQAFDKRYLKDSTQ